MMAELADAAREAGSILLAAADEGFSVYRKSGRELVTDADVRSEGFLRKRLFELDPEASFAGEESSSGKLPPPPMWIVDPLDGTNNFAHGYPAFAVSIAYIGREGPLYGCIHDPLRDECFEAVAGDGARLNGREISCSNARSLSDSLIATGFPYHRRSGRPGVDLAVLEYFLERVQGVRRGGSAALDLAYVACGRLDGFYEENLKPWDMAAGCLLVREAGGLVSAYEGGEWTVQSRGAAASGTDLHPLLREGIEHGTLVSAGRREARSPD